MRMPCRRRMVQTISSSFHARTDPVDFERSGASGLAASPSPFHHRRPLHARQPRQALRTGCRKCCRAAIAFRRIGQRIGRAPGEPKKYDAVVTKDAKTLRGLFLYHKVKEKHYFEIPEKLPGRDLFWSAEVAQSSTDQIFQRPAAGRERCCDLNAWTTASCFAPWRSKRGGEDIQAAIDAVDDVANSDVIQRGGRGSRRSLGCALKKKALEDEKKSRDQRERGSKAESAVLKVGSDCGQRSKPAARDCWTRWRSPR